MPSGEFSRIPATIPQATVPTQAPPIVLSENRKAFAPSAEYQKIYFFPLENNGAIRHLVLISPWWLSRARFVEREASSRFDSATRHKNFF